jgi:FixJ family two-component response regulator
VQAQSLSNRGLRFVPRLRAVEKGFYGVLLRNLLLDVPDPENGVEKARAEHDLAERSHGHPIMVVTGPSDIDIAIRLTTRA